MKIILVRHAEAVERAANLEDAGRYLTPEGRLLFRKSVKVMREEGLGPNLILSSPYLRAVQTADIMAENIPYIGPLITAEELAPGFEMDGLMRLLTYYKPVRELVLVGHEPDLSALISKLLSLPEGFKLRKGAGVKLCVDPADPSATASFKWMVDGRKLVTSEKKLVS